MAYLYEEKVHSSFILKLEEISQNLGVSVNSIMAVIEFETAGTFSPSITNSLGYVGLIQFGKNAAERLGTTREQLKQMTAVQQLDYVYRYYLPYKSKINSFLDLYLATFFPRALGKPKNYVLETKRLSASRIAKANKGFDLNQDNKITVAEIEEKLMRRIPQEFKNDLKKKTCLCCGQYS